MVSAAKGCSGGLVLWRSHSAGIRSDSSKEQSKPMRIRQTLACENGAKRVAARSKARMLICVFQKAHLHPIPRHCTLDSLLYACGKNVAETYLLQRTSHNDRHGEVIADHATRAVGQSFRMPNPRLEFSATLKTYLGTGARWAEDLRKQK